MAAKPASPNKQPNRSTGAVWLDRLLGLCPLAIGILWAAGVAVFRGLELQPTQWLMLVAGGFSLQLIARMTWHRRPLPPLPEGARAVPMAALIATIVAVMAGVIGGILELVTENYFPSDVAWGLRTLWHTGCAFGAVYCAFLQRLLRELPA
ncbi:MAG: hypothetical protein ACI85K_001223 [Hyphomicrobiaceae bacterium]|jgi:hypothetical protein